MKKELSNYTVKELFTEITTRTLTIEDMDMIVRFKAGIYQDRYNLKVKRDRENKELDSIQMLTPHFASERALIRYCEELIQKGFISKEVIENYRTQYKEKYFNNSGPSQHT